MTISFVAVAALPRLHRVSEIIRVLASSAPEARCAFAPFALEEVASYLDDQTAAEPIAARARLPLFRLATSRPDTERFADAARALRDVVRGHALELARRVRGPVPTTTSAMGVELHDHLDWTA
jgi:hypothetical protein